MGKITHDNSCEYDGCEKLATHVIEQVENIYTLTDDGDWNKQIGEDLISSVYYCDEHIKNF